MKLEFFSLENRWPVFVEIDKQLYYYLDDKYYYTSTGYSANAFNNNTWNTMHPISFHNKKTINTKLLFLIYGEEFFTSLKEAVNGRKS